MVNYVLLARGKVIHSSRTLKTARKYAEQYARTKRRAVEICKGMEVYDQYGHKV